MNNEGEQLTEISDDIEVMGPGRMLKEARIILGLTQQQVADKLNFRTSIVQAIEVEQFDHSVPEAFNRGYLKNYAKLVNVSQEEVLNSYEQLEVAQRQCAEMQSFSKGTEKQAEHKMLMSITYLILAILVTATVVWWLQTPSEQPEPIVLATTEVNSAEVNTNIKAFESTPSLEEASEPKALDDKPHAIDAEPVVTNQELTNASTVVNAPLTTSDSDVTALAKIVFTFTGDCWVNIYDATGERIAWGVKKSGYIMRISGQAPFSVTLGRPELVKIDYNAVSVDMAAFNAGNIAKFSLPLAP